FREQLRVGPDGEDVRTRGVEDPLDADLELVRGGNGGVVHRSPFVRSTTWAKRSSRCSHVLMPSKAQGTNVHLRAGPIFSVVTSSASSSSRMCFFIPVSDMPERFGELADRRAARSLRAGFRRVAV